MAGNRPFVHLGARSDASLGESIARVEELCWEAARDGQGFLGLTDVNSVARAPAFAAAAARAGLRPVFGAELDFLPFGEVQFRGTTYRMRLLVENETGWRNLVRLVNRARAGESPVRPPHVPVGALLEDARGLVVLLCSERGELGALIEEGRFERLEEMIGALGEATGRDRLLLELPPDIERQNVLHEACVAVAAHFGLMTVAVPRVCCAHAADDVVFRFMSGEARGETLGDLVRPMEERCHLATRAVVTNRFPHERPSMEVTLALAQHCSAFTLPTPGRRFPMHNFSRGVDAESYIWNTAFARAAERYGDLPTRYKERLNREFREIVEAGLPNAVVTLVRLNEELEREGVQRGPGAGLLTHSMIASLLGLTRVDPLKFDLPFDLPAGLGKGSFPLLELSIPANQEVGAAQALERLFEGQVCPVGEWRGWRAGLVVERAAEVLGRDGKWAAGITRQAAFGAAVKHAQGQPATWMPAESTPLADGAALGWIAARMEGRSRELQRQSGVYTFTVDPIDTVVPRRMVTAPGEEGEKGVAISEWTEEELGELRHGRLAFVHSPLLDLIGESTELVRQQGDFRYAPEQTPVDDGATYRLLREGQTAGIGPLEAPAIRHRLRRGQPTDLHSLIRLMTVPDNDPEKDLLPDFSTVLLCHVCAAIKAHRPAAFLAAALTHAAGDARRTALIVEQAALREIAVAELDVNYSTWEWTVERDGLRPGFCAVRGLGRGAGMEIVTKRRELHFTDIADLCRRTDRNRLRAGHLRALARAGAFDRLVASRREALSQLEELYPLLKSRKGGNGTGAAEEEDGLAFFDRDGGWWVREYGAAETAAAAAGNEDPMMLYAQEAETFGAALRNMWPDAMQSFLRGARVQHPAKLNPRAAGQDVTLIAVGGPVQGKDDEQWALLDAEGCLVEAHGEPAARLLSDDLAGRRLLLTGRLEREPFQWRMDLTSVLTVEEAMERAAERASLVLDLSSVRESEWKRLLALLKQFPGETPLMMEWLPVSPARVFRSIQSRRVLLCPLFELSLEQIVGKDNWRIRAAEQSGERISRTMIDRGGELSSRAIRKLRSLLGV